MSLLNWVAADAQPVRQASTLKRPRDMVVELRLAVHNVFAVPLDRLRRTLKDIGQRRSGSKSKAQKGDGQRVSKSHGDGFRVGEADAYKVRNLQSRRASYTYTYYCMDFRPFLLRILWLLVNSPSRNVTLRRFLHSFLIGCVETTKRLGRNAAKKIPLAAI